MLILGIMGVSSQEKNENNFLQNEMLQLRGYLTSKDSINLDVSSVSVGWHVDHILLTINSIVEKMELSNPKEFKPKINLGRMMMFTFNKIPRGKAESPSFVKPKDLNIAVIKAHLDLAYENLKKMDSLPRNAFFTHPYIGRLKKKQAKKFLRIHTNHHIKIIEDILQIK